ncbi:phytoene desaturase [Candidatus Viridilinea mediisalina]|uniref:Phytoene dehydrogenase n=1 Tax=Candidatus Viridilinea mediisalina TaxID=2024553 RepID=A0A2A6RIC1_9CHLR|nr:phytoene desaturase [Candidatus Viridilinea mediisalina]PDW02691.1 phytoene dehydrogenase [Candidatus Viridilinea mediisalina]
MRRKIIVIGSGFGGLSVAIRLAARGHQVSILEKRDKPGGRAYVYQTKGFTFDSGPTVVTAPFMFDDIWKAAGRRREDYFKLQPCDPYYRIFNHSKQGRYLEYGDDEQALLEQIRSWNPRDVEGYKKFMATTQAIFEKGFVELADKPFLRFTDMLRVAPDLARMKSYMSTYSYVARFIKNDFLRRCFSFHPLFIGGNPFDASSIYAMVHYLEREWGVHHAVGGTGAIVTAMERLFKELGGRIEYNAEVDEILVEKRRAVGVRMLDGSERRADCIVSNADSAYTYHRLIAPRHRRVYTDRALARKKYSMSLVVIYLGINRRYDDTDLVQHNIVFGKRYKGLLHDIFNRRRLSRDFSLYIHRSSHADPNMAPAGCESLYILSPVPHMGSGVDWSQVGRGYRDTIIKFVEDHYMPNLSKHIVAEHMVDPRYYQNALNTYLGSGFSIQPILTQSAWFRPHNRSEDVDQLYFVGAGTHPGAGLPGVLSSAIIVENLIGSA